ncbi:RHS repeat-associated core domain-containing protein [Promicromonospora soli]
MRTAPGLGGVTSLVNDPHGTSVASVHNTNWTTTSVDKHYTLPFGGTRGGAEMPGDRAFLGKTKDAATGLTLIGARWYDESAGRFITVDPIMDMTDPQQWNGYAYAGNSPLTKSDPTGLREFANDDPRDDTQEQIHTAVQHGLGNESPAPTGPPSDPDDAGVTNNPSIDLCKVLFLCPGTEEPINYPKWLDDFDLAADRKWLEEIDGLNAFGDLYLACMFDWRECDAYYSMLAGMPEATVEGTVADGQEIGGAFAAGHYAEGAGLASVAVVSVFGFKGAGKGAGAAANAARFELKDLGGSVYESPAGLVYGPGSKHKHRLTHVLQHSVADPGKTKHSVFSSGNAALQTIDEAWANRGAPEPGDPGAYVIPMGRDVGVNGETAVRIIVKPGTSDVISAYPWEVAP